MNVDEARGRLHRIAAYMAADQQVQDAASPMELRAALRQVFHDHADKPIMVQRSLAALMDEIVVEQVFGYADPIVRIMGQMIRETLDSVAFLTTEGFEEAAWFRSSDSIVQFGLYLDAIALADSEGRGAPGVTIDG